MNFTRRNRIATHKKYSIHEKFVREGRLQINQRNFDSGRILNMALRMGEVDLMGYAITETSHHHCSNISSHVRANPGAYSI
jgi:hypothetical protein